MSKDPTPKADGLRAMREASRGHLQATAEPAKPRRKKLIPFAGADPTEGKSRGGGRKPKVKK